MKKKKWFDWKWEWATPNILYVKHQSFLVFLAAFVAIINPEGFGHWIGKIIHAVKEAI